MADVFISYKREDRRWAEAIDEALRAAGWSTWWDTGLVAGEHFNEAIDRELRAARCVVVIWSADAARSRWVNAEAVSAFERDILVAGAIDKTELSYPFSVIQTVDLSRDNGVPQIVKGVREKLAGFATATHVRPRGASARPSVPPSVKIYALLAFCAALIFLVLPENSALLALFGRPWALPLFAGIAALFFLMGRGLKAIPKRPLTGMLLVTSGLLVIGLATWSTYLGMELRATYHDLVDEARPVVRLEFGGAGNGSSYVVRATTQDGRRTTEPNYGYADALASPSPFRVRLCTISWKPPLSSLSVRTMYRLEDITDRTYNPMRNEVGWDPGELTRQGRGRSLFAESRCFRSAPVQNAEGTTFDVSLTPNGVLVVPTNAAARAVNP